MKADCIVGRVVNGQQVFWADHRPLREREEPEKPSCWTPHPEDAYWMDKASATDMCFAAQGEFVCQYLFNRPGQTGTTKSDASSQPESIEWRKVPGYLSLEEAVVQGTCLRLRVFQNWATGAHRDPTGATWCAENRFTNHTIEIQTADSLEQAKRDAVKLADEWKLLTKVVP